MIIGICFNMIEQNIKIFHASWNGKNFPDRGRSASDHSNVGSFEPLIL